MMKRIFLALSVFALFSCDRHEWEGEEGTSRLYKGHGGHGEHHDDHGSDHGDHGGHGEKDAAHGEKEHH